MSKTPVLTEDQFHKLEEHWYDGGRLSKDQILWLFNTARSLFPDAAPQAATHAATKPDGLTAGAVAGTPFQPAVAASFFCPTHHIRYFCMGESAAKPDYRCIECEIGRADKAEAALRSIAPEAWEWTNANVAAFLRAKADEPINDLYENEKMWLYEAATVFDGMDIKYSSKPADD